MKRIILSVLAGAVVFGSVLGFAASLTTSSDKLGEGGAAVDSCGSATLSYNTSFASNGQYKVDTVDVVGLAGCPTGSKVSVALMDTATTKAGDGQSPVAGTGKTTVTIDEKPNAAAIVNARVIVHSGDSATTVVTVAP